uniref:Reverse transcriptase N-terminal domain-containing protein n=1 Tax=Ophidocladus simpliciusculus TaxID=1261574 RepID=A0A1Z1MJ48_9FLOR|nr:hypothetical protein [Ophidocladus simpliciusculus]ARW65976.1 hypothetical protein [Ophidocladus simpliciusculus]
MYTKNSYSNYNILDQNSHWTNFSWDKIKFRVLMIQKQIYVATKKYDWKYVYKLQKYLINSNEAKILAIKNTIQCISQYYYHHEINTNIFNDCKKFYIFKLLFYIHTIKNKTIKTILEKAKQYLIVTTITPICKAKLSKYVYKYFLINTTRTNLFLQIRNNYINKYSCKKNMIINFIISKLRSYNYVNKLIKNWLYQENFNEIYNHYDLNIIRYKEKNDIKLSTKKFIRLLLQIIYIDFHWYLFNIIKDEYNFFKFISNQHIKQINNYNNSLIIFNYLIEKMLYRKILYGYKKINLLLDKKQMLYRIKAVYQKYYINISSFIYLNHKLYCNNIINHFIYYWIKKQKNIQAYSLFKVSNLQGINKFLNISIYYSNIKKYCCNYI